MLAAILAAATSAWTAAPRLPERVAQSEQQPAWFQRQLFGEKATQRAGSYVVAPPRPAVPEKALRRQPVEPKSSRPLTRRNHAGRLPFTGQQPIV